jgi:hypothetical protein
MQSPVKQLHKLDVNVMLIMPNRICVLTIQAVHPEMRPVIGETMTAKVDGIVVGVLRRIEVKPHELSRNFSLYTTVI